MGVNGKTGRRNGWNYQFFGYKHMTDKRLKGKKKVNVRGYVWTFTTTTYNGLHLRIESTQMTNFASW